MIKGRLQDGLGEGFAARVTADNALLVQSVPINPNRLPFEQVAIRHWQSGYFVDSSSSQDMTVDGSVTPVDFTVDLNDRHVFVERVRLTMHDGNMRLDSNEVRRWGSAHAAGLSNGIELQLQQAGEVFDIFTAPVQRVSELWRYADNDGMVGITDGVATGTDLVVFTYTFMEPLALEANTEDRLILRVNDDLTAMTLFEAGYSGYHVDLEE